MLVFFFYTPQGKRVAGAVSYPFFHHRGESKSRLGRPKPERTQGTQTRGQKDAGPYGATGGGRGEKVFQNPLCMYILLF